MPHHFTQLKIKPPKTAKTLVLVWCGTSRKKSGPQEFFTRMQPQKNTARFLLQRILQKYRSKTIFFRNFCQNYNPNLDWNTRICQNCLEYYALEINVFCVTDVSTANWNDLRVNWKNPKANWNTLLANWKIGNNPKSKLKQPTGQLKNWKPTHLKNQLKGGCRPLPFLDILKHTCQNPTKKLLTFSLVSLIKS